MVAILRLIWGLLSRALPALALIGTKVTAVFTAAKAAHAVLKAAAIAALLLWLPLPGWLTSIPSYVGAIPAEVVYLMEYAKVKEGVAIVVSAMVLRFVARLLLKVLD